MENEVRLINAAPIKKFILDGLNSKDPDKMFGHDAIEILTEIEYAPVIDPESLRPKGRWINDGPRAITGYWYHCSECGKKDVDPLHKYCPNCGAKMEDR